MRIANVRIMNVNTVKDGFVDFENLPPLTLVRGHVKGGGASSNGAGKSTVFNAIVWGLYGRELWKRPAANLIRRGEKRCQVDVEVVLDDGKRMRISRTRDSGGVSVTVNDKPLSTATGAQSYIERKIGFTYELFVRTVVFGGDVSAFCRMTPAERTQILEEMVGIGSYLRASQVAKDKAKEKMIEIGEIENKLAASAERTAEREARVSAAEQELTEAEGSREAHRREVQDRFHAAYEDYARAMTDHGDALCKDAATAEARTAAYAGWKAERDGILKRGEEARTASNEADKRFTVLEQKWKHAVRERDKAVAASKSSTCPTCGQAVKPSNRTDPTPLVEEAERIYQKVQACSAKLVELEKAEKKIAEELRLFLTTEPESPKASQATVEAERRVVKTKAVYDNLGTEQQVYTQRVERAEYALKKARDAVENVKSNNENAEESLRSLRKEQDVLLYWQKAFSRDGIPSLILDAVAPSLNASVEPIAQVMTDGMYSIAFENTSKDSGKSDFKIHVENQEGGDGYDDLSKGEKTRADLCVLFAIRSLLQERSRCRCDQMFIDELADGLDADGVSSMVRLFRSGKLAKQIVYISHDPFIQDAADGFVTVSKSRGVSAITQGKS